MRLRYVVFAAVLVQLGSLVWYASTTRATSIVVEEPHVDHQSPQLMPRPGIQSNVEALTSTKIITKVTKGHMDQPSHHQRNSSQTDEDIKNVTSIQTQRHSDLIRFPSSPDPRVWSQVSLVWHNDNGTKRHNLIQDDKHVGKIMLRKCHLTSQFELSLSEENWILYTLTEKGERKSVGGDEMYIKFHSDDFQSSTGVRHPTAVANIIDNEDGSYSLDFIASPYTLPNKSPSVAQSGGHIEIELEYSCGLGKLPHGTKLLWNSPGCILLNYSTVVAASPPIRPFRQYNIDEVNLSPYNKILLYGDSNLQYLAMTLGRKPPYRDILQFTVKPESPLNDRSIHRKFLKHSREYLNATLTQGYQKVALVIGSNIWDLVFGVRHGSDFTSHKKGCKILMQTLRKEYPNVDMYWYSGVSVHPFVLREAQDWHSIIPLRYMSRSRALQLYQWQRQIMASLDIKVLDFFPASQLSGEMMAPFDARHYTGAFWATTMPWFYSNASTVS